MQPGNLAFPYGGIRISTPRVDYPPLIAERRERFSELEEAAGDPAFFSGPARATGLPREIRVHRRSGAEWMDAANNRLLPATP